MKITGSTKLFCIIGMPAHHSLSPAIHNAAFKALDIDAVFTAFDVPAEKLEDAIKGMKALDIKGMTLTSPHKEKVMKYLDYIDKLSMELGAVNTIVNKRGKLYGYNTDTSGFVEAMKKYELRKNAEYVIFGAGGAARAFSFGLAHEGVKNISIINRTVEHARELKNKLEHTFPSINISIYKLGSIESMEAIKNSNYIINATNITLENRKSTPVRKELMKNDMIIFDANYAPLDNRLLMDAKAKGCRTINGLELLVNQGLIAFKLFVNKKVDYNIMMKAALEKVKLLNK
ncbi:MAG: shikimate dehydrogenase [Candidatus Marsarchaeota archaeon]|nr:shikimate dehydrogenase [Candidatus Marsarchaeota archaeon]